MLSYFSARQLRSIFIELHPSPLKARFELRPLEPEPRCLTHTNRRTNRLHLEPAAASQSILLLLGIPTEKGGEWN